MIHMILPYADGSGIGEPASSFSRPLTFGAMSICCTRIISRERKKEQIK